MGKEVWESHDQMQKLEMSPHLQTLNKFYTILNKNKISMSYPSLTKTPFFSQANPTLVDT